MYALMVVVVLVVVYCDGSHTDTDTPKRQHQIRLGACHFLLNERIGFERVAAGAIRLVQ